VSRIEDIVARNAEWAFRLENLVRGLSAADCQRSLGDGWTVTTALTHLTFWVFRQAEALRRYAETGTLLEEDLSVNPALKLTARGMAAAGRLAIEAAKRADEAASSLAPIALPEVLAGEHAYLVQRFEHREDHIAQIERALG